MQGLRLKKGIGHFLLDPGKYHGKVNSVWRWREMRYWMKGVSGNGYTMRLQFLVQTQGSCVTLKSAKQCWDENLLGSSNPWFYPSRPENVNWAQHVCKQLLQERRCQWPNSIHCRSPPLCRLALYETHLYSWMYSLGASWCKLGLKIILFHAKGIIMLMFWNLTRHSAVSHPEIPVSYRMEPIF